MMRMISLFGAALTALLFTGCTAAPEPQLETARQMIQTNRAECVLITADGRGLKATADATVMVRGSYTIG